ncbi:MAG TPA: hypothetical protein VMS17_19940 [Gemmataceae bacterium]|nr:hypothetical protein [Gemmataceae bacterium]
MRFLTLTTAALFLAAPLLRADDRKPPPDAAAQAKSETMIKALFKEEFAKKKAPDVQALAAKMIQQAADAKDDATSKFVLLRMASELAAKAGDAADAVAAIDAQAAEYAVNAPALKARALETALHPTAPGATVDAQAVLDAALPVADEAQAADDFDAEIELLHAAQTAATKLDRKPAAAAALERSKMVEAIQKEHENIKADLAVLKDKPQDPDANLHVGRYLCFFKGDWEHGLPLLAAGSDDKLKELVKKDMSNPTAAADQMALADAWMDLASSQTGVPSQQIQLRAGAWYKQAAPQLTGLDKAKAEKAAKDIDKIAEKFTVPDAPPEPGWVVLFRSADPRIWDKDVNIGKNGYAIPLSQAPDGVQYLKLKWVGTNHYVIIPMTNENLRKRVDYDTVGWDGENRENWHGYHLGIYSLPLQNDFARDNVVVSWKDFKGWALGWGFGHRIHRDDFQGYSWAGVPALSAVFEISVKAGPLTETEAKALLTKKEK